MQVFDMPADQAEKVAESAAGMDMASFIPLVLTEDEAWHLLLYVRSFNGK